MTITNTNVLRRAALIAVIAGSGGSLMLLLRAGQRNNSRLLLALMASWVLSPFVALLWAWVVSKRWSVLSRTALYGVMMAVALGSLALYTYFAFRPPKAQPASVYILIPPASWLLAIIVLSVAASMSRKTTCN